MLITAMTLFAALAIPPELAAQKQTTHFRHYKLIDIGTFSGPQSYLNIPPNSYAPVLNNRGSVAGSADTSTTDPFPNFCFNEDCFVSHAFRWHNGIRADLGTLDGGASSAAFWISASGLTVGISQNGETDPLIPGFPEFRAVLWRNGGITDLGTLQGGHESAANAVNSRGQVAGLFQNTIPDPFCMLAPGFCPTQTRAFRWQDGVMEDLGTLGGPDAMALLINERGQIVGDSYTNSTPSAYCANNIGFPLTTGAFIWENGDMKNLGNFGGTCTFAFDLNNRGQVIGASTLAGDQAQHPFLWERDLMKDLGTFGGNVGNAIAINNAGEIAGWANLPDQIPHAFLWKNGTMTDLGTVDGDPCSIGFSINATGQVVGISVPGCDFNNESTFRAFLWEHGGPMIDLNTLIPPGSSVHLSTPATINDRGEITGLGILPNGDVHVFLLIPCGVGNEGCESDVASGTTTARGNSTMTVAQRLTIRRMMAGPRTRLARIPGLRLPRN